MNHSFNSSKLLVLKNCKELDEVILISNFIAHIEFKKLFIFENSI